MKLPFDRSEWDFEELTHRNSRAERKRVNRNVEKFINWMQYTFEYTAPRPLEEGEKYHWQGMRMHPENNLYLKEHIDSWTWVDASPKDDESVKIDELEIDHWFKKIKLEVT